MFVRTATRRNKDGSAVRYVQLVHNEWDPATKSSRMRVVHSFGREDQLDRAAVERLAGSLGRLLGQDAAGAAPELAYAGSGALGGTHPAPTSSERRGRSRSRGTRTAAPSPRVAARTRTRPAGTTRSRPGSACSASPRTTAMTCPRS